MTFGTDGSRFKLVALDIDGTVLTSTQKVSPELRETLARLSEMSVRSVLCTGRRWHSTLPVLRELGHAHPVVVCSGGSLIKRADDEQTLHAVPLEIETARLLVELFRRAGLVPMLLYDRRIGDPELRVASFELSRTEQLVYAIANPGAFACYEGDFPEDGERPLVVYSVDRGALIHAAEPAVREGVGGRAIVEVMEQPRYGPDQVAIEAHDPKATKWNALSWLLERWQIAPEEVVAVGDDVNDIPMLRAAGMSFAMGNASEEVKAAAMAVTASNDRHGVVEALKQVFPL